MSMKFFRSRGFMRTVLIALVIITVLTYLIYRVS